jgi:hypothetical protein
MFGRLAGAISARRRGVARDDLSVYHDGLSYTSEAGMTKAVLTRTNLLLETGRVRLLRKALQSKSNSEAVRRVINERLAAEAGLQALRDLRRLGGPEDVFGRAARKSE